MRISIVVPVYNAETYLAKCLDSLVNQSYRDIEIVVVDDGSKDESGIICKNIKEKDSRIKYFYQENQGVSAARNLGIDKSSGDYIMFVDSDDYLDNYAVEKCVAFIEQGCNLICFNFSYLTNSQSVPNAPFVFNQEKILDNKELVKNLFIPSKKSSLYLGYFFRACWGKLFDLKLVREYKIRFPVGMKFSEDAMFVLDFLSKASNVKILDKYLYHYRIHESSAVQSYKKDFFTDVLREYQEIKSRESSFDLDWNCIYLNFWFERSIAIWRNIQKRGEDSCLRRCALLYKTLKKEPYQGHFGLPDRIYKLLWYVPFALKLSLFQTMAIIFTTRYRKG